MFFKKELSVSQKDAKVKSPQIQACEQLSRLAEDAYNGRVTQDFSMDTLNGYLEIMAKKTIPLDKKVIRESVEHLKVFIENYFFKNLNGLEKLNHGFLTNMLELLLEHSDPKDDNSHIHAAFKNVSQIQQWLNRVTDAPVQILSVEKLYLILTTVTKNIDPAVQASMLLSMARVLQYGRYSEDEKKKIKQPVDQIDIIFQQLITNETIQKIKLQDIAHSLYACMILNHSLNNRTHKILLTLVQSNLKNLPNPFKVISYIQKVAQYVHYSLCYQKDNNQLSKDRLLLEKNLQPYLRKACGANKATPGSYHEQVWHALRKDKWRTSEGDWDVEVVPEKWIGAYHVDFYVSIKRKNSVNPPKQYVLEIDEDCHFMHGQLRPEDTQRDFVLMHAASEIKLNAIKRFTRSFKKADKMASEMRIYLVEQFLSSKKHGPLEVEAKKDMIEESADPIIEESADPIQDVVAPPAPESQPAKKKKKKKKKKLNQESKASSPVEEVKPQLLAFDSPFAQYLWALQYFDLDKDKPKNDHLFIYWLNEAANNGLAIACVDLGICYLKGHGVSKDLKKAAELYQAAAAQGFAMAQHNLARAYDQGMGVSRDLKKAVELYQAAAAQGFAMAQYNLASFYGNGHGVSRDLKKAAELYQAAAAQGFVMAQHTLALCYENGYGVSRDLKKAAELYQAAAAQGDAAAQCNLAHLYGNGYGVSKDLKKAAELYQAAAAQGDASAQCNLASFYGNGYGVSKDLKKAVELFQAAAAQGFAKAQHRLALCYENGIGVSKDLKKAAELYQAAAAQGFAEPTSLALCYEGNGYGVSIDLEKVAELYQAAADQGDTLAEKQLTQLKQQQLSQNSTSRIAAKR
jgi:TPR repeat protein